MPRPQPPIPSRPRPGQGSHCSAQVWSLASARGTWITENAECSQSQPAVVCKTADSPPHPYTEFPIHLPGQRCLARTQSTSSRIPRVVLLEPTPSRSVCNGIGQLRLVFAHSGSENPTFPFSSFSQSCHMHQHCNIQTQIPRVVLLEPTPSRSVCNGIDQLRLVFAHSGSENPTWIELGSPHWPLDVR